MGSSVEEIESPNEMLKNFGSSKNKERSETKGINLVVSQFFETMSIVPSRPDSYV